MFQIAKSVKTTNEVINFDIVEVTHGCFDKKLNQSISTKQKELEIYLTGSIDKSEYGLHFIVSKPIEEFFNLEKFEKIKIGEQEMNDCYFEYDGKANLSITLHVEVLRFSSSFVFTLSFQNDDNDYFGNANFEIEVEKIKEKL